MSAPVTEPALDPGTPVLVLKLDINPFHHGALAVVRSLGRSGVPVYAVMEGPRSPLGYSRHLSGRIFWTPDLDDVPALLAGLREIGESIGGRPLIIPTDDAGAILLAEHADVLTPLFRLPDQPRDLARQLASKEHLAELCIRLDVPTPKIRAVPALGGLTDVGSELAFPIVVKIAEPWQSGERNGVKSTTIVQDAEQLAQLSGSFPPGAGPAVLLQEYLPAETSEDWFFHGHVGADADGSAAFRMSVTGQKIRSYPPTAGITTLGRAWDNPELRAVAEHFLGAVGYRGIVDLDFRLDRRTGAYHLLDANPRPGAQFAVARRSDGIDAAQSLHRELTGRPLDPQKEQSRDHALCVENYDAASAAWSLVHRRLTLLEWRRSLSAGPVELAWFARDDVRPALRMWTRFVLRPVTRLLRRRPDPAYPRPILQGPRQAGGSPPASVA
jgi:predicted ATP-grasp superfamily ATP-dependent carboligase